MIKDSVHWSGLQKEDYIKVKDNSQKYKITLMLITMAYGFWWSIKVLELLKK